MPSRRRPAALAPSSGAARRRRRRERPSGLTRAERRARRRAERPRLSFGKAVRVYGPWVVLLGALVAYPHVMGESWALTGSFVAVYALVALSLTIVTGWTGAVSLGQAGFVGSGAFLAALLTRQGIPFAAWLPLAAAISVPASLLVGLVALRLPRLHFAVATLALNLAAGFLLFRPLESNQVTMVDRPHVGSVDFADERHFFLLVVVVAAACFGAALRIKRGKTGRALLAVRDSPTAAAAAGIEPLRYRVVAFVLSGALAAMAGVLFGCLVDGVRSDQFTPLASAGYLAAAVIGGLGSVPGAAVAGVVHVVPVEVARPVLGATVLPQFTPLVLSALLLVVLAARPDGLAGLGRAVAVRARRRAAGPARELALRPRPPATRSPGGSGFGLGAPEATRGTLVDLFGEPLPEPPSAPAALDVRGVSVHFGPVAALDDVSLRIEPGELVAVVGPNGAGKTTLLDVCSGFRAPAAGRVLLDGRDITEWGAPARVRAGLGRTFQTPCLAPSLSVSDNLLVAAHRRLRHGLPAEVVGFTYALREEGDEQERIRRLLDILGLTPLAGQAAGDLPPGLLKVVEVCRALVDEPRAVLLDEASAGLDPAGVAWLGALVRSVAGELGVAVVLVERDLSLATGVCDYVYVLHSGRLLAAGPPDEVVGDARVIAAYRGPEAA